MQLPFQGKFEERPGWALRPADPRGLARRAETRGWAQRPAFGWQELPGRRTAWSSGVQPGQRRARMFLSGLLPNVEVAYTGDPRTDYERTIAAMWEYTQRYSARNEEIFHNVSSILQSRGYQLTVIETPQDVCNPAAGCVDLWGWRVLMQKDGRSAETEIGGRNWYTMNSSSYEDYANRLERDWQQRAVPSSQFQRSPTSKELELYQQQQLQQLTFDQWKAKLDSELRQYCGSLDALKQWLRQYTNDPEGHLQTRYYPQDPAQIAYQHKQLFSCPQSQQSGAVTSTTTTTQGWCSDPPRLIAPDGHVVGGRFTLKVCGPPGQTVSIRARQNNQDHGITPFGATDGRGRFEISGVWGPEHAGQWYEEIYVGNSLVGTLNFTLSQPTRQPGNTSTTTPDTGGRPQPPQVEMPSSVEDTGIDKIRQEPGVIYDDWGQSSSGSLQPLLLIGVAALAAFFLFKGDGKEKK